MISLREGWFAPYAISPKFDINNLGKLIAIIK